GCSLPASGDKPASGQVWLWDLATGPDGKLAGKKRPVLKGARGHILAVAFAPDGATLASVGGVYSQYGEVCLWDVPSGRLLRTLHGHTRWLECVTFDREGGLLYTGGGPHDSPGEVRLWQAKRGGGWVMPNAHASGFTCAAWSADGSLLATGSADRSIKVWDSATGKLQAVLTGHEGGLRCLAFS